MIDTLTRLGGHLLSQRRHLVLVDAENLAGCAVPSTCEAAASRAALMAVLVDLDDSYVVVACNHLAAPAVSWAWPRARLLWRSGRDGADLALLEVLASEKVSDRFDRVTVCSGDHLFAEPVAALGAQGVKTTVVGLAGHISSALRLAAMCTIEVSPPLQPDAGMAA